MRHVQPARRPSARAVALAVALAALASACGAGGGGQASAPPITEAGGLAAAAAEVADLDRRAQEERLLTDAQAVEHATLALSGLEEELGGPEAAIAAYDAMALALTGMIQSYAAQPAFSGPFGAPRSADAPSLGAMLFASMMMASLAPGGLVAGSNDVEPGGEPAHAVRDDSSGTDVSRMTQDATVDSAALDWTVETTAAGVTGKIRVAMKVNPCPGPDGTFTADATIAASSTSAGGRVGSNHTITISITAWVDDDARLAGYDVETTSEAAEFGSGNNVWAEVTDSETRTGGTITAYTRTPGRSAGNVPAGFADQWANLAMLTQMMVTGKILEAAQQGWESGRCVALDPTTSPAARSGLAPSTTVTISAAPRSKVDGGSVGGSVVGTLTGTESLDPAGSKVPADATFTYVAPGEAGQSASVALEARSRRGVARATLVLDTSPAAYDVSGSLASLPGGTTFSGTICRADQPFTVPTAGDMVGTASFTPTGAAGGTLTYSGVVGNAPLPLSGAGTYAISASDGGPAKLDVDWQITLEIPTIGSQTEGAVFPLTLTPRAAC